MKVKRSVFDTISDMLSLGVLIGIGLYMFLMWSNIPEQIPGHYNFAGEVDKMSAKSSLIITLIVGFALYALLSVVVMFPQTWNTGIEITEENKEQAYRILKSMIQAIKVLICCGLAYIMISSMFAYQLSFIYLILFVVSMIAVMTVQGIRLFRLSKKKEY